LLLDKITLIVLSVTICAFFPLLVQVMSNILYICTGMVKNVLISDQF